MKGWGEKKSREQELHGNYHSEDYDDLTSHGKKMNTKKGEPFIFDTRSG